MCPEGEGMNVLVGGDPAGGLHVGGGGGGDDPSSAHEVDPRPLVLWLVSVSENHPGLVSRGRDLVHAGVVDLQDQVLDVPAAADLDAGLSVSAESDHYLEPDVPGEVQPGSVPGPGVDDLLTPGTGSGLLGTLQPPTHLPATEQLLLLARGLLTGDR